MWKEIDLYVNIFANVLTIVTAIIAICVFIKNKENIKTAFNFILSYSNQLMLAELKSKIEKLNDFKTTVPEQKEEIINLLHEIEGHILGNLLLKEQLAEQLRKIRAIIKNPSRLEEPKKRSLVSELKESVRNLDVSNFGNSVN